MSGFNSDVCRVLEAPCVPFLTKLPICTSTMTVYEDVLRKLVNTMISLEHSDLHGEPKKAAVIALARVAIVQAGGDDATLRLFDLMADPAVELIIHASKSINVQVIGAGPCLPCRVSKTS